jgi:CRISPR-associated protein Cas6
MIDVAFALRGRALPRAHRRALAAALQQALPWLADEPLAAVHRLNVSAGGGDRALLSGRTRLTLRVPRSRLDATLALAGRHLEIDGEPLDVGGATVRELLPFGTLYAHFVAAATPAAAAGDEGAFLDEVGGAISSLHVAGRAICGRHQGLEGGALHGYSLMLDGLTPDDARVVLHAGVGAHRLLGCGVFVPHKSAAAVGMPH